MLTPRRPLGVISGNIAKRKELTLYERGLILGAKLAGRSEAEISKSLNVPDPTVRSTIIRATEREDGHSKPRSGRPKCLSDREERILIRHIRLHPKDEFKAIKDATGLQISNGTIKNICRKYGITHWRAKKRPALTEKAVKARYE
jgi:transposase